MIVNASLIKELRKITGAGIMDCKAALLENSGNVEKATIYLRKKGIIKQGDRAHKEALEGTIGVYSHTGGRICAMVEVNCETDFVARSDEFKTFAYDLAIHIAATNPTWVSRDEVPQEVVSREQDILSAGIDNKPEVIKEKIISGKVNKFFKETCLLEQPFVRDSNLTVQDVFNDLAIKVKEKIVIKRFNRFEVGVE